MHGMQEEGNEEMWNKVWQKYLTNSEPTEKYKLMKALTQTRLVWLIHRSGFRAPTFTRAKVKDGLPSTLTLIA